MKFQVFKIGLCIQLAIITVSGTLIGNDPIDRGSLDTSRLTVIIPDPSDVFTVAHSVTHLEFYSRSEATDSGLTRAFIVFLRPLGAGNYRIIGKWRGVHTVGLNVFDLSSPIDVLPGDTVGFYWYQDPMIPFDLDHNCNIGGSHSFVSTHTNGLYVGEEELFLSLGQCRIYSLLVGKLNDDSGKLDPHFMLTSKGSDHHMCFDFNGKDEEVLSLLEDDENDIYLNGELYEVNPKNQTYFKSIALIYDDVTVIFNSHSIEIEDESLDWDDYHRVFDDFVIEVNDQEALVEMRCFSFIVTRGYHGDIGYFMGVYVTKSSGLSKNSKGLIGQFVHSSFAPSMDEQSIKKGYVMKFDDRHSSINVKEVTKFSRVLKSSVTCWLYRPEVPDINELLGDRENYLMYKLTSKKHLY